MPVANSPAPRAGGPQISAPRPHDPEPDGPWRRQRLWRLTSGDRHTGESRFALDQDLPTRVPDVPCAAHRAPWLAALMRAVLEDAISCFQKQFTTPTREAARLAREAEAWLFAEDDSWPLSCGNVCAVLGLPHEYLRRGLTRWRSHTQAPRWRKRRQRMAARD